MIINTWKSEVKGFGFRLWKWANKGWTLIATTKSIYISCIYTVYTIQQYIVYLNTVYTVYIYIYMIFYKIFVHILSSASQKYYFASQNVLHPFPEKESILYFVFYVSGLGKPMRQSMYLSLSS